MSANLPTSADLHFVDLLKLRPFTVSVAFGSYFVTSMTEKCNVADCGAKGRRNAYLICAILNSAVHPDAIQVLQGIIDDDGPGVSLKDQSDRWYKRLADAEGVIAKSRAAPDTGETK